MRMIFMGPPGAGKGTQAALLAQALGTPHIATGDIFRANVANKTELGQLAQQYMNKGEYVPDEVTNAMVADRLKEADAAEGFILDGYPRTLAQVHELDRMLAEQNHQLDVVIELVADEDEIVQRLLQRAQEQGRADDTEDVIRHRMQVYTEQTAPLTQEYGQRDLLQTVDGLGSVDQVSERVLAATQSR